MLIRERLIRLIVRGKRWNFRLLLWNALIEILSTTCGVLSQYPMRYMLRNSAAYVKR